MSHYDLDHLETKTVILEEVAVLSRVIVQLPMGEELVVAPPIFGSLLRDYSAGDSTTSLAEVNDPHTVFFVLQLIDYSDGNLSQEGPLQVVIKFTSHYVHKH